MVLGTHPKLYLMGKLEDTCHHREVRVVVTMSVWDKESMRCPWDILGKMLGGDNEEVDLFVHPPSVCPSVSCGMTACVTGTYATHRHCHSNESPGTFSVCPLTDKQTPHQPGLTSGGNEGEGRGKREQEPGYDAEGRLSREPEESGEEGVRELQATKEETP